MIYRDVEFNLLLIAKERGLSLFLSLSRYIISRSTRDIFHYAPPRRFADGIIFVFPLSIFIHIVKPVTGNFLEIGRERSKINLRHFAASNVTPRERFL